MPDDAYEVVYQWYFDISTIRPQLHYRNTMPDLKKKRETDPRITRIREAKQLAKQLASANASAELANLRVSKILTEIDALIQSASSVSEGDMLSLIVAGK